jgi:hypothetical protein
MRVAEFGEILGEAVRGTAPCSPEGTPLWRLAREAHGMADAYLADGRTFLSSGDTMNALAAITYASGWLDASLALGLLSGPAATGIPDFAGEQASFGGDRFREKRARYRQMLASAAEAVECSPDPGSPLFPAAVAILDRAGALLAEGDRHVRGGREGDALACFSHGHGWLDAGVRAGLFRILHSRELFTAGPL